MPSISDAEAFQNDGRVLTQHQAAITLLQQRLLDPDGLEVHWLDLACGRGQILLSVRDALSEPARRRLHFVGVEIDQSYVREAQRVASSLELGSAEFVVSDLDSYEKNLPRQSFDFITFVNVAHEIPPVQLPTHILNGLQQLANSGTLFMYDMERLVQPELGAVTWRQADMQRLVQEVLAAVGVTDYQPNVSRWHHSSTSGWSLQLHRDHLNVTNDRLEQMDIAELETVDQLVERILRERLSECDQALASLKQFGPETANEEEDRELLLYDYWALKSAIEELE